MVDTVQSYTAHPLVTHFLPAHSAVASLMTACTCSVVCTWMMFLTWQGAEAGQQQQIRALGVFCFFFFELVTQKEEVIQGGDRRRDTLVMCLMQHQGNVLLAPRKAQGVRKPHCVGLLINVLPLSYIPDRT